MHRRHSLSRTLRTLLSAAALSVCLFPLQAQDPSAKLLEMAGQVSVLNGGYQKALFPGDSVQPQQLIVTGPDGFARFQVADGSTFEVYANSKVIFRENRGNWIQLLNVWLGRVKVFIQHKPGIPNPNEVSSPTAVISVRGTVFDVEVRDEDTTIVSVDEGLVSVRNHTAPGNSIALHPGESIVVIRNQPLIAQGIDKSGAIQAAYRVVRDTMWQVLVGRRQAGATPGTVPTSQGDKGKGGGTTTTTPAPGSPPGSPAPGAPPGAPPGGGGG